MTPTPFPLPRRILPPAVAYAAGIVCEHRPDLADGVRAAVLGDDRAVAFNDLMIERVHFADEGGAEIVSHLSEIVHYGGFAATDLHALAVLLGVIPRRTSKTWITTPDHMERIGDPTIGDVWAVTSQALVCGLPADPWPDNRAAHEGAALLVRYLRDGFSRAWAGAFTPGEREALRRLVPIHAHTVSMDPSACAAWSRRHIDILDGAAFAAARAHETTLGEPYSAGMGPEDESDPITFDSVRPQSPDQLN